jgi:hypothetical protein
MPNLNLDVDYFDHPKTKRLVGLLGRGADVLPIRLWSYCGKFHCEDGKLSGYSAQEIESIAGWWGKTGMLMPAMVKAGFAVEQENGWEIHEWKQHQGHLEAFRIRGKHAAETRWSKLKDQCSKDATSIAKKEVKQCSLPTKPSEEERESGESVARPPEEIHSKPRQTMTDANLPTWEEVKEMAKRQGVSEETAKKFFDHHEGNNLWTNRFGVLVNVYVKLQIWANEERTGKHANNKFNGKSGVDRNAGTANAGKSSQYAGVGKVQS